MWSVLKYCAHIPDWLNYWKYINFHCVSLLVILELERRGEERRGEERSKLFDLQFHSCIPPSQWLQTRGTPGFPPHWYLCLTGYLVNIEIDNNLSPSALAGLAWLPPVRKTRNNTYNTNTPTISDLDQIEGSAVQCSNTYINVRLRALTTWWQGTAGCPDLSTVQYSITELRCFGSPVQSVVSIFSIYTPATNMIAVGYDYTSH